MKLKEICPLIDSPIVIMDNDGYEYKVEEAADMEVVSLQHGLYWIIAIVEP